MKNETAGEPIIEFIGLRPKMYSFEAVKVKPDGSVENFDKHRAKGIQRVVAAGLRHAEYLAQLTMPEESFLVKRRIGARLQQIYGKEL